MTTTIGAHPSPARPISLRVRRRTGPPVAALPVTWRQAYQPAGTPATENCAKDVQIAYFRSPEQGFSTDTVVRSTPVRRGAHRFAAFAALGVAALLGTGAGSGGGAQAAPSATSARTQLLLVDAVAYSLTGRTSSGRPVGRGVVAVDPRVIPMGSRMFVPGYGQGIAADRGSAVRGHLIDVWFPTLAEARAWGRRTLTITVYR